MMPMIPWLLLCEGLFNISRIGQELCSFELVCQPSFKHTGARYVGMSNVEYMYQIRETFLVVLIQADKRPR